MCGMCWADEVTISREHLGHDSDAGATDVSGVSERVRVLSETLTISRDRSHNYTAVQYDKSQ
jgi:hypothetical protein